jgi:hypothetical protein
MPLRKICLASLFSIAVTLTLAATAGTAVITAKLKL